MAGEDRDLVVGTWFVVASLALWLDGYRWWTTLLGGLASAIALAVALEFTRRTLRESDEDDGEAR